MQQGGGGGGGTQSQFGEMTSSAAAASHMAEQQPVEPASPISSRPPATSVTSNLDELMRLSGGGEEDEGDRAGGVASGGNRWPRQETLALIEIRSDMDAVFRDATVKGPLWEDVSRKMAELGYKRSAKKCKEKFENVHKYYKRTKEGRAGRQDGKSYKFFSQLEAFHSSSIATVTTSNVSASSPVPVTTVTASNTNTNNAHTITLDVAPVSIGIPMPISSVRIPTSQSPTTITMSSSLFPPGLSATIPAAAATNVPGPATTPAPLTATTTTTNTPIGISFSSNSSLSPETEDDDDGMDFEGQPSNTNTASSSRKRKRQSTSSSHQMMQFFEGLMKQVMQKQEVMQQRFLEVIEMREQDRIIRAEAWKRQEMIRLAREQELMAQERAISASRDTAIISFLQKITGQTIHLPPAVTISAAPPQPPPAVVASVVPVPAPTQSNPPPSSLHLERREQRQQQQTQQQHRQVQSSVEAVRHQVLVSTSIPSEVVMAIPEKQLPPQPQECGSAENLESSSSRWPKVEVLALIKLRSGLELRYQEAGPKGPLWEEISAGMKRMGFSRIAKRCKEKWENINKYFKKVKESNKQRPEDAKTCPYFHELDALYGKKVLGGASTRGHSGQNRPQEPQAQQHQQDAIPEANPQDSSNVSAITLAHQLTQASESENKNNADNVDKQSSYAGLPGNLFGEGNGGASQKPEDIVKELMNEQGSQQQHQTPPQPSLVDHFDKIGETNMGSESDNMDREEDYEDDEEDDDEELEEERKMSYKVEFQRQNGNTSNGGGNGAPSFLAMVQ